MTIDPTLRCPCAGRFLEAAFHYDTPPEGETAFPLHGADYVRDYGRCTACDHWFGRHSIPLDGLYSDTYVDATYGDVDGMVARLERVLGLPPERSDNAARVTRITSFRESRARYEVPKLSSVTKPRVLDVGAGIGVFPAGMLAAGWDVVAVEPDPRTVQMLRERLGIRAESKDFLELQPVEIGAFDVVTFNKVLEHVEDPLALLNHSAAFLADGGFCYVEVPDTAAATAGPGREEFFIEHHHVFSPASLGMLGDRSGLHVEKIGRLVEPSGKYTIYAFMTR